MNTIPRLNPIVFFELCMNVDINRFSANNGSPISVGVRLNNIYCLWLKSPLNDNAMKLNIPNSIVIEIIYIRLTIILFFSMFDLFMGKNPKYSIVFSDSSFNTIFDPSIDAYSPIIINTNMKPSDFNHPYAVFIDVISILNAFNKSFGNTFIISSKFFIESSVIMNG